MRDVIAISVGELALKGKNRKYFENALIEKINRALAEENVEKIYKELGKIYVETDDLDESIKILKNVFGISYISKNIRCERDIEEIKKAVDLLLSKFETSKPFTFKIITTRAYKEFPYNSPEINNIFGEYVLKNYDMSKVDVHNPDIEIHIEIRKFAYVSSEKVKALGGMPMGTNGKALALLSGGIDSPVASFMMGRRGIAINGVHFHSYPYTSERAEKKVIKLAELVARYTGPMKLYSVNNLEIQKSIAKNCKERNTTILSRRFMMRIATKISQKYDYDALITGDNLGQVASQTIESLKIIDKTTDILKFRPLISMDKQNIIDIAEEIGTYETSILPFDDCCTIFAPEHPNLHPTMFEIEKEEEKLDIEDLVDRAISGMKIIEIE